MGCGTSSSMRKITDMGGLPTRPTRGSEEGLMGQGQAEFVELVAGEDVGYTGVVQSFG